jgi:hypothetical protein
MRKIIILGLLALLALTPAAFTQAPQTVDSVQKTAFTVTGFSFIDFAPDTLGQIQWLLIKNGATIQSSPWLTVADDSTATYTFSGLDTMTTYYVQVDKFPFPSGFVGGIPYQFTTDTIVVRPTMVRDSIQKFVSQSMIRYHHHGFGGNDTSLVEVVIGFDPAFAGPKQYGYQHMSFNRYSGFVQISFLPQNQLMYVKSRRINSSGVSAWTATDTFTLSTSTPGVAEVSADSANASYTSVNFYASATLSNLLRIRWNIDSLDLVNGNGNVGGTVYGTSSPLNTSLVVTGLPQGTRYFFKAESDPGSGFIESEVKGVSTLTVPTPLSNLTGTLAGNVATLSMIGNSYGFSCTIFGVMGTPTISQNVSYGPVTHSGVLNGGVSQTVSNLQYGSTYQFKFGIVIESDTFFTNVVTLTTGSQPVVTPFTGQLTSIEDQINVGGINYSDFHFKFKSENALATVWLEVSNDYDTTFFQPLVFASQEVQSPGSGQWGYESIRLQASDIYEGWDMYSDIFGRWVARVVGYNSANSTAVYSQWMYFYPRGQSTGVDDVNNMNEIKIFPNPVMDYLIITSTKKEKVELYDASGKFVATDEGSEVRINFNDLPAGVYFLKTQYGTKKIVK